MKWAIVPCLLMVALMCLACGSSGKDTAVSPTPCGRLSSDEAESILYEYLKSEINTVTDNLERYVLANYLARTRSRWCVHSREAGQPYLEIAGMGFDGFQLNDSGVWRVYDVTATVEPQNHDSRELLVGIHIQ